MGICGLEVVRNHVELCTCTMTCFFAIQECRFLNKCGNFVWIGGAESFNYKYWLFPFASNQAIG